MLTSNPQVADTMKEMAAIWHTKAIGDGWGHVIHGAFALGRPIIGIKSYYSGMRAYDLWKPNVNCLDLSGEQFVQAAGKVNRLLHDPDKLIRMGEESAKAFYDKIDYERDAENIRKLFEDG
jgi:hypothetical protein